MELQVEGRQAEVLDRIEAYFALDWPHGGMLRRGLEHVEMVQNTAEGGLASCAVKVATILTLGVFLVLWAVNTLARQSIDRKRVRGTVQQEGERVRITRTGTYDWLPTIDNWLRREFVYGRHG